MRIGDVEIQGRAALAPMAGVTDSACRQICQGFGTAYTVTEMVSAKAIQYGDKKSRELADLSHDQGPVFLQIFGDDPQVMAGAAQSLLDLGPAGFDINMGCPVPKVAGNGCGQRSDERPPALRGRSWRRSRPRCLCPSPPKCAWAGTRNTKNVVEVARICQQAGADAVCVHGRTRDQMYAGKADWQAIRRVKESLSIPVIANGDVTDAFSAAKLLEGDRLRPGDGGPGRFGQPLGVPPDQRLPVGGVPPHPAPRPGGAHSGHPQAYRASSASTRGRPGACGRPASMWGGTSTACGGAAEFRRRAGELATLADLDRLLSDVYEKNQAQA